MVNDCFKNESNAIFGVFLQRLINLNFCIVKKATDLVAFF